MIRILITCFVMILTNLVIAEAAPQAISNRIEPSTWTATHIGQGQMDGIEVVASLELAEHEISIPEVLANGMQTLVPLAPMKKKVYRLSLVAADNANLKAEYTLKSVVASVEGSLQRVFISGESEEISFLISPNADQSMAVHFSKKISESLTEEGDFILQPAVRTMN